MSKYIKSHSNFVLKTKHQDTKDGVIYERDITTIGGRDRFSKGQVPVYRSGNFVITVNNEDTLYKKTPSQEWKTNDEGDIWTLDVLDRYEKDDKSSYDKRLVIKKDYHDLRDFSYFGSCSELMRASINGIISKFPGELFTPVFYENEQPNTIEVTYTDYANPDNNDYTTLPVRRLFKRPGSASGHTLFYIDNPYSIDIYSPVVPIDANPLKYFVNGGIFNYVAYKKVGVGDNWDFDNPLSFSAGTFSGNTKEIYCPGELIGYLPITISDGYSYNIYVFMGDNNEVKYFVDPEERGKESLNTLNYRIRPKKEFIDEFFENLDNFEKVLLNKNNDYTATFEVFREGDYGYYIESKSFKFPTTYGGYNLGSSGYSFTSYINNLVKIGEFYDENFTDNIWRSMTHEAIKNFDWTYTRRFNPGDEAEFVEGGNKIEKIIRVYGREFDEIKTYIDAIADNNTITYDNANNLPDYFFSDKLEDDGWDVKLINPLKFVDSSSTETVFSEVYPIIKPYKKGKITSFTTEDEIVCEKREVDSFGLKIKNIDCSCDSSSSFECVKGASHKDGYYDNCCHLIKIYSSEKEYNMSDINAEFFKRFILNSKSILRHKGTIDGIEMLLGMFGLKSRNFVFNDEKYFRVDGLTNKLTDIGKKYYAKTDLYTAVAYDYDIKEYTLFTTRFTDTYDSDKQMYYMDWINSLKLVSYNTENFKNGIYESYQGLPVSYRYSEEPTKENPNPNRYIYPSYQNYLPYDGELYYQMNGGWISKEPFMFDNKNNIIKQTNENIKRDLFTETLKNVKCVETLSELLSNRSLAENKGDICQVLEVTSSMTKTYAIVDGSVYDLLEDNGEKFFYATVMNKSLTVGNAFFTDYVYVSNPYSTNTEKTIAINLNDEAYNGKSIRIYVVDETIKVYSNSNSISTFTIFDKNSVSGNNTNYFRINDPDFNNELSVLGWEQLKTTDYEYHIIDAITDYNKGNNPHTGHMNYDKGHEYLNRFAHLFKPIYENGLFNLDEVNDDNIDIYSESYEYGFKHLVDENECVKNYDDYLQEDSKCHYFGDLLFNDGSHVEYKIDKFSSLSGSSYRDVIMKYGNIEYLNYGSDISNHNNLDGVTNQIVNTKRVDLIFYLNSPVEYSTKWLEEIKYIDSVILPYVSQIIPSNIILTVKYKSKYNKEC